MTDRTKLRRLAEKATPGPWITTSHKFVSPVTDLEYVAVTVDAGDRTICDAQTRPEDAAYIAAMHPKTTLALLDQLDKAEAMIQELRGKLEVRMRPDACEYYREPLRLQPIDRDEGGSGR